ncbi:MAG: LamG-like jellyroll fold domain-containing protein [Chthoniobacterales bacterium]
MAWYPGDGNSRDIAGGDNGILQNGATFAAGQVGQAFSFDGVDDQVLVPHSALQNSATITIDAWVNPTSPGHGRSIVNKRSASNIGGYTLESVHSPSAPTTVYSGSSRSAVFTAQSSLPRTRLPITLFNTSQPPMTAA